MQFSHQQRRLGTPAVVPMTHDIMCGSGHSVFSHPGNVEFRSTVEENAESYANASTKMLKSRVAKLILAKVRATGARILKKDPVYESWHVATKPEKVLRDKITNYLRVFFAKNRSGVVVQRPLASSDPPVSNERDRAALPPGETQDNISVRTIQQMQASPTSGNDSLDSWMQSLFDTLIEEPLICESTTTKVPVEIFEKNSFSSPAILSITSTGV